MLNAEVFADVMSYDFEQAIRCNNMQYAPLLVKMEKLRLGKFKCNFKFVGSKGASTVTTEEVIGILCKLGETELVAWILQDLKMHGALGTNAEEEL